MQVQAFASGDMKFIGYSASWRFVGEFFRPELLGHSSVAPLNGRDDMPWEYHLRQWLSTFVSDVSNKVCSSSDSLAETF